MKKINPIQQYFYRLFSMFKSNIRDYGMYIALFAIFITFTIITGGSFLGARNFTNLLNQTAYVAVLAVGMTLVIVIREIDLSVGYLGAYLGGFLVVSIERNNMNIFLAILVALLITLVVGFIKGSLVAKIKIPSFVVTLGGMFIFKGLLMSKTKNTVVPTSNQLFQKIGIGYLSTNKVFGLNTLTLIIGILIFILIIVTSILTRIKNDKFGVENEYFSIFITKLVFMLAIVTFTIYTLASHRGISYLLLITALVTVIYHFVTTKTVLGRRIYAVGGNPEAAELSGISVGKIVIVVFMSMGVLALISGLMYVSNVQNTSPQHGPLWELYAIAAAYIGGTSARGGVGKVVNAVIGAIVMMSLQNGMKLAGIESNIEPVILGSVLVLAVIFDIYTRNVRSVDYVGIYYAKQKHKEEYTLAKKDYLDARTRIKKARKAEISSEELIEFEYELTRLASRYNEIRDVIRNSKEEDFNEMLIQK